MEEKKKVIVTKGVKEIKESEFKKFFKKFFAEDIKDIGPRLFEDVVIPGIKKLIVDSVQNGIAWIFGTSKSSAASKSRLGNVSYSEYYINSQNRTQESQVQRRESIFTVSMQEISDRAEAEEVLEELRNSINLYGSVKVSDYYDMLGKRWTYTDERYGWRDLSEVTIKPTVDGYILTLPPAIPLNIKQM